MKRIIEKWGISAGLITLALLGTYVHSGFMVVYSFGMWLVVGICFLSLFAPSEDIFKNNDFSALSWAISATYVYFTVWNNMPILASFYILAYLLFKAKKTAYFKEVEANK